MTGFKQPGDPIELGDTLGYSNEPGERRGRLVGIRNDDCRPIERYIIREFRDGDGDFPTGEYCSSWLIIPWAGP